MATSSSPQISSSDRLTLSLTSPVTIRPESTLEGTVDTTSFSHCSSLEISVIGSSSVTIMGKMRWQMAQAASGAMAPPITSIETHVFCQSTQVLWTESGGEHTKHHKESSGVSGHFPFELLVPERRTCNHEIVTPTTLPPSLPGLHPEDQSSIKIEYYLTAKMRRKLFHRDEKCVK